MKKIISFIIAAVVALTCCASAFAVSEYTITYDPNNSAYTGETPVSATVVAGESAVLPSALVVDGNTMVSWNTKADGTGLVLKLGASFKPNANTTLYAQWQKSGTGLTMNIKGARLITTEELDGLSSSLRNYSVNYFKAPETYTSYGAEYVSPSGSISRTYADYAKAVRPVLVLDNVISSGHNTGSTFTFAGKKFVIISKTAAFCVSDIAESKVYDDVNTNYMTPYDYESSAIYRFLNEWFNSNITNGYKFVSANDDVNTDTKTYTLTYNTSDLKKIDSVKLAEGATVVKANAEVEGYKFNGWFTDKEFKNAAPEKMPASDLTLYASYTKLYKLSFDTNGVQKIADQWYAEGAVIALPEAKVDGYTFIGWFADKEYKTLNTLTKMPKQDTVLYGLYAANLSRLANELKEVDVAKIVSDMGLSADTFKKLAQGLGFEISYTINGKEYKVEDIVNYVDEITKQVNVDVSKGETAGVDVTIKLGKDDSGKTYTFTLFNDMGTKAETTTNVTTTKEDKVTTTTKVVVEDKEVEENDGDIPSTGSASIIPAVITLLTSMTAGGAVMHKKKKED